MAHSTHSSDFHEPGSEVESTVGLRVHKPPAAGMTAMPGDKIIFPRRMLYIEAVLYLCIAAAAFGLGYLIGRGGSSKAENQSAGGGATVESPVPLEGLVTSPRSSPERGETDAVVIVLPADASPAKLIAANGLRPSDPPVERDQPVARALTAIGGATTRTNDQGRFTLTVPRSGTYRILIIARGGSANSDPSFEQADIKQLDKYFVTPAELLGQSRYLLRSQEVQAGMKPIQAKLPE